MCPSLGMISFFFNLSCSVFVYCIAVFILCIDLSMRLSLDLYVFVCLSRRACLYICLSNLLCICLTVCLSLLFAYMDGYLSNCTPIDLFFLSITLIDIILYNPIKSNLMEPNPIDLLISIDRSIYQYITAKIHKAATHASRR